MSTQKKNAVNKEASGPMAKLTAQLLPVIARKKAACNLPKNAGSSFFYEIEKGWEADVLRQDEDVCVAKNTLELEDAFLDQKVKTILIPYDASITQTVALRVCRRHGLGKTIFYEGS